VTQGLTSASLPLMYFLVIITLCMLASLFYNISLNRKLGSLIRRYRNLLQNTGSLDIDSLVDHLAIRVEKVEEKLDSIAQAYEVMAEDELRHIRSVGLVRFNAFERQSGEQSFSVAWIDAKGNGVILTSLYGRDENRLYAKAVKNGHSEYPLSSEEKEALSQVWKN
jgi:hypothetical protein